jgi:hypothetical protein
LVEWNKVGKVVDMNKTTLFKLIPVCINKVKVTAVASIKFPENLGGAECSPRVR